MEFFFDAVLSERGMGEDSWIAGSWLVLVWRLEECRAWLVGRGRPARDTGCQDLAHSAHVNGAGGEEGMDAVSCGER